MSATTASVKGRPAMVQRVGIMRSRDRQESDASITFL